MAERFEWLDTLKGLGIILVILGHFCANFCETDARLTTYIYSFHIPLFFFVSGYLFDAGRYVGYRFFLKRRFFTRIIPYLFFYMISYVIILIKVAWIAGSNFTSLLVTGGFKLFLYPIIIGLVYANGEWLSRVENVALWFLPCLFVAENIFYALHKIVKADIIKLWLILFGVSLVAYFENLYVKTSLPWTINGSLTGVVFCGLGFTMKELSKQRVTPILKNKIVTMLFWGVFTIICAFLALLNGRVDMNENIYGNYLLFYGAAISGIISYVLMAPILAIFPFFSYLGRNSIIMFGLHMPIGILVYNAFNKLAAVYLKSPVINNEDIYVFALTTFTIVLIIPFAFLINNYFSFIIGKKRDS